MASLQVKPAKVAFLVQILQIVQIAKPTIYAESMGGRANPPSSANYLSYNQWLRAVFTCHWLNCHAIVAWTFQVMRKRAPSPILQRGFWQR